MSAQRIRVAVIGGGSTVFSKMLITDLLAGPVRDIDLVLQAPSTRRTALIAAWGERFIEHNGLSARIIVETDRAHAIEGARYVFCAFQVGGLAATESDYVIPMRYGVDQCIGDTLGPGGVFRALRAIPVAMEVAEDVARLAPEALILNYVNPMAMVCWALGTAPVRSVGLCHGTQVSLDLVAGYTDTPRDEIDFLCAGINHLSWFVRLEHRGSDLYPRLRERFEDPRFYANEKVRGEVFRQFGYFMTESTGHLSEYLPWFRSTPEALATYCDEPMFGGESGAHLRWSRLVAERYTDQQILEEGGLVPPSRSHEYGPRIVEALETGVPFAFQGNRRNDGAIDNLPDDACIEGPMTADAAGLHPVPVGGLPDQCAAVDLTNINVQRLAVRAALLGDAEAIVHALALDPLTGAVLTLRETRALATELLEAQRPWLPQFEGRSIRAVPAISVPKDIERATVPIDPALAIAKRFDALLGGSDGTTP